MEHRGFGVSDRDASVYRIAAHVAVATPELASKVWLEATREHPDAEVSLTRVAKGYQIAMTFKWSV